MLMGMQLRDGVTIRSLEAPLRAALFVVRCSERLADTSPASRLSMLVRMQLRDRVTIRKLEAQLAVDHHINTVAEASQKKQYLDAVVARRTGKLCALAAGASASAQGAVTS